MLYCKRKIFWDSARNLLLKWMVNDSHVETRGDIWASHARHSYVQKDANSIHALAYLANYRKGMLLGVNTMLIFLFVLEMSYIHVCSTTANSVLFEVAQVIHLADYKSWKDLALEKIWEHCSECICSVECSEIKVGSWAHPVLFVSHVSGLPTDKGLCRHWNICHRIDFPLCVHTQRAI